MHLYRWGTTKTADYFGIVFNHEPPIDKGLGSGPVSSRELHIIDFYRDDVLNAFITTYIKINRTHNALSTADYRIQDSV